MNTKPARIPPPRIDPSAASQSLSTPNLEVYTLTVKDRPFLRTGPRTPNGMSTNPPSISPTISESGHKSQHRLPLRSATSPLPRRSPSPSLTLPQDCAFPPFPGPAKQRNTAPKSPLEVQPPFSKQQVSSQAELGARQAQPNPRNQSGENFMRRMNTIAPGPFKIRQEEVDTRVSPHKSTSTINRVSEMSRPPSATSMRSNSNRPATAGSERNRKNSLSSISGGPRSGLVRAQSDGEMLSSGSASIRTFRPDQVGQVPPIPLSGQNITAPASLLQDARSQVTAADPQSQSKVMASSDPLLEKAVKPSYPSHTRVPSVAAANRPLHEIGSTISYRPHRPALSLQPSQQSKHMVPDPTRAASANGDRKDGRIHTLTQFPRSTSADDYKTGNPYHTPTESTSSNEWSNSDAHSSSSRSSPPLSASPYSVRRRPSDTSRIDNLMNDIQATISKVTAKDDQPEVRRPPPPSFSRPMYARTADLQPRLEPVIQVPDSPLDSALQPTTFSPITSPITQVPSPKPFQKLVTETTHLHQAQSSQTPSSSKPTTPAISVPPLPQQPLLTTPVRRPTTANKGSCRGCNELIQGKSVSSADGRLTGRYHKKCFVCKTCKEPFQTADFYVIDNHPYCSRHYHQLNGSLCKACDRGIEGQYLETELKQKFHPYCFSCQVSIRSNPLRNAHRR